jgi:ATP-dependent Clp protease ATP-binding subunit ClpC
MREHLTEAARRALDAAQTQARELNQDFVGTEHLFLGVLADSGSEAGKLLTASRIKPDELRNRIMAMLPKGERAPIVSGPLPLSPKAQHVLNAALVKAGAGRLGRVPTRLLLLALLNESGTGVVDTFRRAGVDLDHLHTTLLSEPPEAEA